MGTRIGWCAGIENGELLTTLGYDYIECAVVALKLEDAAALAGALPAYKASPLPTKAWNCLFPGDLKVVGPEVDKGRLERYLHTAVEVLSGLGAERVVFGSGGARRVPEGWEWNRANSQLLELLAGMADAARGSGLVFVVEPLNARECNIINSVGEAVGLVAQVDRPEVRVLADFYHMDEGQEPLGALELYGPWLSHIHLADTGRKAPGTGGYPYDEFVRHLRAGGYDDMVSVECGADDLRADAASSLEFIRNKWRVADAT